MTRRTGGQNDLVNVESTPSAGALIQTGAGNDVVHASPTAANLETVNGLQVDGGAGTDAFHVHDQNNPYELPGGADYTITPDSIGRFAEHVLFDNAVVPMELGFSAVESATLAAGNQHDRFDVVGEGGAAAVTLDGNGGADEFHVTSPAFASLSIQGDAPIFFPGDQLVVNEIGLYSVATIPGLYPQGAGGVSIDSMTISYTGIEQASTQPQIYGGPGDFDSNGVVNGQDLTHGTLGWNVRFGNDLDGRDFLVWQRNVGANRLPRGGVVGKEAATTDEIAQAPAAPTAPAGDERYSYVFLGTPPTSGAGDESDETFALAYEGSTEVAATPTSRSFDSPAVHESAMEAFAAGGEWDADEADDDAAVWDAALAEFGPALMLAV
jgi:hypothetical protein